MLLPATIRLEDEVLRLRGGAPPSILLPARHVAGKRQRGPYKRAARKLAKFAADQSLAAAAAKATAESPELPADDIPDAHAHSSNPDSSDSVAEHQAEEEESTHPDKGTSMTVALEAEVKELEAQIAKAVAEATRYKRANKELKERAAWVTSDSSSPVHVSRTSPASNTLLVCNICMHTSKPALLQLLSCLSILVFGVIIFATHSCFKICLPVMNCLCLLLMRPWVSMLSRCTMCLLLRLIVCVCCCWLHGSHYAIS